MTVSETLNKKLCFYEIVFTTCMVRFMQFFLFPKVLGVSASEHTSTVSQLNACLVSNCQSGLLRVNKSSNTGTKY